MYSQTLNCDLSSYLQIGSIDTHIWYTYQYLFLKLHFTDHDLYYDSWLNHVFAKTIHNLCKKIHLQACFWEFLEE